MVVVAAAAMFCVCVVCVDVVRHQHGQGRALQRPRGTKGTETNKRAQPVGNRQGNQRDAWWGSATETPMGVGVGGEGGRSPPAWLEVEGPAVVIGRSD